MRISEDRPAAAQKEATIKVTIAHPCDDVSLRGAVEAKNLRLIEPILMGLTERVRAVAAQSGIDIGGMEITNSAHSHDSAAKAVELVAAGTFLPSRCRISLLRMCAPAEVASNTTPTSA